MIHLVMAENRGLYEAELLEYHRLRHDIYVVERNWTGLQSQDGREYDSYDTEDATYLLSIENDRVTGGSRLYPTLGPHMLEEVCPQLADVRGIPSAPDIWEWTRIFVRKDRRDGRYGGIVLGELFSATIEYGLDRGLSAFSFAFEAWWLPRLQALGWKLRPLGLPSLINGDWWIAATLPLDSDTLYSTRSFYELSGPTLQRKGVRRRQLGRVA